MNQLVSYARIAIIALYAVTLAQSQTPNPAAAKTGAVPSFVRFSGTAKDINGDPMNGVVGIIFSLYADEQSSAPLWSEHQNAQLDASGGYKVSLGASNPLPMELFSSGEARWLGVQVSGGTQEKRTLLLSVPYALKAADAETIGGLPPSAFVLAGTFNNAPSASSTSTPTTSSAPAPPPASAVTTAGGTVNTLPLFSTATNIQNSLLSQVGTTTINVGGKLNLPAIGAATTTAGTKSRPQTFMASSFNSGTAAAVNQNFQWQAEPAGNNTASPSGTLNLLFGSGTTVPVETGLKINNKGQLTFAAGQAFPGAGTLTGITTAADSGLAGGGATGNLTLSLLKTCATNQVLQWNGTTWVCATISGGGGGGTVTSIGLKAPGSDFTVSGSPITSSGTLSFAWLVPPTSVVTANALVKRDGTGSFSANVVTATSVSATTPLLGGAGPAVSVSSVNSGGVGVSATGGSVGVYGSTIGSGGSSFGVQGSSMDATAVRGDDGGTGSGVVGTSVGGYGTYGSGYNAGVYGTGLHYGVVGAGTGIKDGFGVYGIGADNSATPAIAGGPGVVGAGGAGDTGGVGGVFTPGIYTGTSCAGYCGNDAVVAFGYPPTIGYGYAGNFNGDLNVKGSIYAGGKDFKIDHPLDPANKYLFHASVESSEMMNIYTGNVTTDGQGDATVALPEWFEALNTDFRYQVTVIGQFAQAIVAHKMENNQFTIKTSTPNVEVSWQVTGVRQDAFAKAHPLVVEQDKELPVKGFYIHPDLFGAPQEKQIEWARHPQLMKQLREIREKQAVHLRTAAK